ncbi:hypothetical protein [Pseudomonas sediminis]|uniref:hypothetical protein n=1 Tax=Pseudomonas sediminis TaxID=1691904 RepID=UPI0031CC77BE
MTYQIVREKFSDGKSMVETFGSANDDSFPKLNLKIRKSDLRILRSVSISSEIPRSQILNEIVGAVLARMLKELASDDKDCAARVAAYADNILGISLRAEGSWSDCLFRRDNHELDYYYSVELPDRPSDGFSEQYMIIDGRIKRAENER